ncbi:hypothetical protein QBC37DRAFT_401872 [Rhypophila decipiens]|uniref:Nephrocystin 3-like N-terminal domain-containing protein n=1 Tax=Rhypophila decipiens TaxID=261697 RepID=A0AAN7B6F6_9PEZI|nr:hypothetical protein QBC37DRAFT_401872 [Rhypophila decipiens]
MTHPSIKDEARRRNREWLRSCFTRDFDPEKQLENVHRAEPDTVWVQHNAVYEAWKSDPDSRVLWVTGPPACGKSVIARHLFEKDLPSVAESKVYYHSFSPVEHNAEDPFSVAARSILSQILAGDPDTHRILPDFSHFLEEITSGDPLALNSASARDGAGPGRLSLFCILDGPDSVVTVDKPEMADCLGEFLDALLSGNHSYDFKVLITCRPIFPRLEASVSKSLVLRLENHMSEFERCLETYLRAQLSMSEKVLVQTHKACDGSFLAASTLVSRVKIQEFDLDAEDFERNRCLHDLLTATLNEPYKAALRRTGHSVPLATKMLEFLSAAARRLTRDELVGIACSNEDEATAAQSLIDGRCDGFLSVDSHAHIGLVGVFGIPRFISPKYRVAFRNMPIHREMAQKCLDLLLSSARSKSNTVATGFDSSFLDYAARYWYNHANKVPMPPPLIPSKVVAPGSTNSPFWNRVLKLCKPASPELKVWFPLSWRATYPANTLPDDFIVDLGLNDLMVASYFGLASAITVMRSYGTLAPNEREMSEARDRNGQTAMHIAARKGHAGVVRALARIESAAINIGDSQGQTPLHLATKNRHYAVVQFLVRGADLKTNINATDSRGQTPLHYAAQWGGEKITGALLDANVTVDIEDCDNQTPRMCASGILSDLETRADTGTTSGPQLEERAAVLGLLEKAEKAGTALHDALKTHRSAADRAFDIEAVTFDQDFSSRNSVRFSVEDFLTGTGRQWLRDNQGQIKWLHLPANNMLWIEVLMKQFEPDIFPGGTRDDILRRDAWLDCQHRGSRGYSHATFMKPQCGQLPVSDPALASSEDPHAHILFPPPAIMRAKDESSPSEMTTSHKLLLQHYLDGPSPLHNRRTLDQYRYYNLQDTIERDEDQLFGRVFGTKMAMSPLLMVDQLWLWRLPDVNLGPTLGSQTSFKGEPTSCETSSYNYDTAHYLRDSTPKKEAMSVVNPVEEMGLLREIKETIDELQILGDIFKDELKILTLAVDKGVLVAVGKRPENTPTAWKELISLVTSRWEEVQEMTRDATRASQSLNDLIDLKQKFSNILEARWSRTMAEEASRQAEETAKQGTTLMVFTSVTIVFLPLSFMAAFFALDVAQFPRNEADQLDLGTVSQYIFLISAVVVAPLLFIAFNVTRLGALRQATKAKIHDSLEQAFEPASISEDADSIDTKDSENRADTKLSVTKRHVLVWALLVVPMNEVRFACFLLLKATDKLHIRKILYKTYHGTVADSSLNSFSSPSPASSSASSLGSTSSKPRPSVRPGIQQSLFLTKSALRVCLLPLWLLILCFDILAGGMIYLVSWLVMYPNPQAERVKILFASTMFSLHQEKIDAGWMDWTSDSSIGSGI